MFVSILNEIQILKNNRKQGLFCRALWHYPTINAQLNSRKIVNVEKHENII